MNLTIFRYQNLFYFTILFAFCLLNVTSELSEINHYIKWTIENLQILNRIVKNEVDCVNLVAELGEFRDELDIVNNLMIEIFKFEKISIRYRNQFI